MLTPSEDCPNSLHSIFSTEQQKNSHWLQMVLDLISVNASESTQYEQ